MAPKLISALLFASNTRRKGTFGETRNRTFAFPMLDKSSERNATDALRAMDFELYTENSAESANRRHTSALRPIDAIFNSSPLRYAPLRSVRCVFCSYFFSILFGVRFYGNEIEWKMTSGRLSRWYFVIDFILSFLSFDTYEASIQRTRVRSVSADDCSFFSTFILLPLSLVIILCHSRSTENEE